MPQSHFDLYQRSAERSSAGCTGKSATCMPGKVVGESQFRGVEVSQVLFRLSRWENLEHAEKI
ncbi:hypothetical protein HMPREF1287_01991 [Corynebacterium sp. KPL1986]|nr:hypothetical protein HMPREF1293_00369 [Corynebacterium sp. KPL1996]ERS45468.1 hypothetical protein HMPREF1287_01991 [Corynebacterium sp. KPL1986]ERS61084.1 hypothetical protein HMPREF1261_00759 [Corynebacterium sp. KPL1818]ERS74483.1 hypothetical protein HMPREF1295_00454 [Corynebacterium sp. KPL1998]ERS76308.1 hypothetical protein HMPREF1300_00369 [Corynebacterium sp. KPL2004]UQZ27034.1 hypothetical protein CACC_01525 [Corynebacterium accolens]